MKLMYWDKDPGDGNFVDTSGAWWYNDSLEMVVAMLSWLIKQDKADIMRVSALIYRRFQRHISGKYSALLHQKLHIAFALIGLLY